MNTIPVALSGLEIDSLLEAIRLAEIHCHDDQEGRFRIVGNKLDLLKAAYLRELSK